MEGDVFSGEPLDEGQDEFLNQRLGMYQVLRKIGAGGMGSVFLALQADQEFKKYVAVKVIRKGMDTEEFISRFRRERQILASLDHPNIARLLDGGTTEHGLPYFVMEQVEGKPLTEYCDDRQLGISDRLDLFRSVCSAVQYAHQKLVVHRDIKPANILVTADGMVKLLDFGIAKILNPEVFELEYPPTATNVRVMTPEYASPEQARAEPITTASDVYSLGVVLYELLTGLRPYEFTNRNQMDVCRIICEQQPTKPSTALSEKGNAAIEKFSTLRGLTSQKLRKQLYGDLDNIVLTALRKEPQLRYASAQALSDDIGRYLDGYAVHARQPTWRYRAGKYVTRHKIGVAASMMFIFLLVASTVMVLVQNSKIRRERDAAEQEKQKAEQVTKLLVDLFEVNDPAHAKGETITAREILDRGAKRITKEFQNRPDVQAQLMQTIGAIYEKLGLYDQAQSLLKKGVQVRKTMHGTQDPEVAIGLRSLATVLNAKGQYDEAEKHYREALGIHRTLLGEEHTEVATDLIWLAQTLRIKGQLGEAEKSGREALAIHRKLWGNEHSETASDLIMLGMILHDQGRFEEAEKFGRQALAIHRKVLGNEHPSVGEDLNMLGLVLLDKGELEESEKIFTESLVLTRKLLGNEHINVANAVNNLALALDLNGKKQEAETLYREALEISRKALGNETLDVATQLNNIAILLLEKGELDEADKLLREAVDITAKSLGPEHRITAEFVRNRGMVIREKGNIDEAEKLYSKALAIFRKDLGDHHRLVAATMTDLAGLQLTRKDTLGAIAMVQKVLDFPVDKLPEKDRHRTSAKSVMAACLIEQQKYPEAEKLLLEAYALQSTQDKGGMGYQNTCKRILNLYKAWNQPEKAQQFRLKASL